MQSNKITVALDEAISIMGLPQGHQVHFMDGLPSMDDGVAFYISQLAGLEARVYEAKYPAINFDELIPVETEIGEWADSWDYISYDGVTIGKFIGSSADDLPNVALSGHKSSVPISYAGNMYEYSLDEMRKAQRMRIPLSDAKGRLARRGAMEHIQRVAYFGDSKRNMTGLFNNPNLALDNSTLDWFDPATTGAEIAADMNQILIDGYLNSATVHVFDTIVLPANRFALIASKPMSETFPEKTVLKYFLENNQFTALTGRAPRVHSRLQLQAEELAKYGVSNGNKDRILAYEMNDENLAMQLPIPWRPLAPQLHKLMVQVFCEYKCSGAEFRFPFSGAYRDQF